MLSDMSDHQGGWALPSLPDSTDRCFLPGVGHDVANRLQYALDYRKMSVTDLQWETRIPERTLRRWLAGVHEPKLSNLKALCKGLGVDANYLAGITDEIEPGVIYPPPAAQPAAAADVNALESVDAPPPSDQRNDEGPGRGLTRLRRLDLHRA
jgi:hypothetical protein